MRALILAFVTVAAAGCLVPDPPDGAYQCAPTGQRCPTGYSCIDGACFRHAPDMAVGGGGPDEMPDMTLVTPSSSTSSASAQPASVVANGISMATITVVVRDADGKPIAHEPVFLSSSGSGNTITQSDATDENGSAVGRMSSTVAETKTVTAALGGAASTVTVTTTVDFTAPKPVNLIFSTQPSNAAPHAVLSPAVLVKAVDADNLPFTGPSVTIKIALVDVNPASGAVLSGSTSVSTNQGVAKFDTLSVDKPAAGFKLTATYDTLTATSSPFTVSDTLPSPPTNVQAVTSKASTITVTWTSPDVDHFIVSRGTTPGGPYTQVATLMGTVKSYFDPNMLKGSYFYTIKAVTSVGESGGSAEANADAHQELCVANNAANAGAGSVTVISGDTLDAALGVVRSFTRSLGGPFGLATTLGAGGAVPLQIFTVNNTTGNNILGYPRTEDSTSNDAVPTSLTGPASALNTPTGLAYDAVHDEIIVVSTGNNTILGFDRAATGTTAPKWSIVGAATGQSVAEGVAVDGTNGHVYVGNFGNNRILTFRRADCPSVGSNCAPFRTWTNNAGSIAGPVGMYFQGGTLFVANQGGGNVAAFDNAAAIAAGASSPAASRIVTSTSFSTVNGVVVNGTSMFVANDKSVILLPRAASGSNAGTTIAPNGLNGATGIAFCN